MAPFLIVFLALQLLQTTTWAKVDSSSHNDLDGIFDTYPDFSSGPLSDPSNVIDELPTGNNKDDLSSSNQNGPLDTEANSHIMQTSDDEAVLQFRLPIKMAHLDNLRNAVVLKFQTPNANILNRMDPEEFKRLRTLQENSMRLGKRTSENYPKSSSRTAAFFGRTPGAGPERSHQVVRDLRGDNFMRFGRSGVKANKDFMRFGRAGGKDDFMRFGRSAGQDFMRFGRDPGQDFMRFGRDPGQDFMRFGRSAGQDFMRFGRDPGQDFMRFGRSAGQDFMRFGRDPGQDFMRFGRDPGQDFMRFGRDPGQDFMRFGRDPGQDFMRFGRAQGQDFMRFGRDPGQDFMRFGRNPGQDFMRFGRAAGQDLMRFGRSPGQDFMRFGRDPSQDFMRFGRSPSQDFMRFGRSPASQDFMRFGRSSSIDNEKNNFARYSRPDNFMRFGRTPPQQPSDFMRFGKSPQKSENQTSQTSQNLLSKNELKQAVKLIHEADNLADRGENPVDKAIKVLFDKHQQQEQQHTVDDQSDDATPPHEDSGDLNMDMDYIMKMTK